MKKRFFLAGVILQKLFCRKVLLFLCIEVLSATWDQCLSVSHLLSFLTHKGQLVTLQVQMKKTSFQLVQTDMNKMFRLLSLNRLAFSPGGPGGPGSPCQTGVFHRFEFISDSVAEKIVHRWQCNSPWVPLSREAPEVRQVREVPSVPERERGGYCVSL